MALVYPVPTLPDGRRARVSSAFGEIRSLRKSDLKARGLTAIPKVDKSDPTTYRRHLGVDVTFARQLPAELARKGVPAGESSPIDPYDSESPNSSGQGFPRSFVPPAWPALATEAGTVIRVGHGNGWYVALLHETSSIDGANSTVYVHLDNPRVSVGDRVYAGQQLGDVGAGVNGGRRHLHLDRRSHASETRLGTLIDPGPYIAAATHRAAPRAPWLEAVVASVLVFIARAARKAMIA